MAIADPTARSAAGGASRSEVFPDELCGESVTGSWPAAWSPRPRPWRPATVATPVPRHHVQGHVRRVRPGTVPGHADDLQDRMPARGLHGPQVRVGAAATGLHQDRLQDGLRNRERDADRLRSRPRHGTADLHPDGLENDPGHDDATRSWWTVGTTSAAASGPAGRSWTAFTTPTRTAARGWSRKRYGCHTACAKTGSSPAASGCASRSRTPIASPPASWFRRPSPCRAPAPAACRSSASTRSRPACRSSSRSNARGRSASACR